MAENAFMKVDAGATLELVPSLSPAQCKEILLHHGHPNQRKIRQRHVQALARAMSEGKWRTDLVNPIRYNKRKQLIDGFHRLSGAVMANFTLKNVLIATVSDEQAIRYLDCSSAPRSVSDARAAAGLLAVPPGIQSAIAIEACDFDMQLRRVMTKPEVNEAIEDFKSIEILIALNRGAVHKVPTGTLAGIARCLRKSKTEARGFFAASLSCENEVGDYEANQAKELFLWIEKQKIVMGKGNHFRGGRAAQLSQACAAITFFNAWIRGEALKHGGQRFLGKPIPEVAK